MKPWRGDRGAAASPPASIDDDEVLAERLELQKLGVNGARRIGSTTPSLTSAGWSPFLS